MSMYVLIIMSWFGGYVSGYSYTPLEFTSLETCEVAKAELTKAYDSSPNRFKAVCVKK
jgi:hypothetical protein